MIRSNVQTAVPIAGCMPRLARLPGVLAVVLLAGCGSDTETKTVTVSSPVTEERQTASLPNGQVITEGDLPAEVPPTAADRRRERRAEERRRARHRRYLASQRRTFSGNGGLILQPFRVGRDSRLRWQNDGSLFQIFDDGGDHPDTPVLVNSQASSGTTFLSPGRYRFQINAVGSWTITIRPA